MLKCFTYFSTNIIMNKITFFRVLMQSAYQPKGSKESNDSTTKANLDIFMVPDEPSFHCYNQNNSSTKSSSALSFCTDADSDCDDSFSHLDDEMMDKLMPALHSIGLSSVNEENSLTECGCQNECATWPESSSSLSFAKPNRQPVLRHSVAPVSKTGSPLSSGAALGHRRLSHDSPAPAGPTVAATAAAALLNEVTRRHRRISASDSHGVDSQASTVRKTAFAIQPPAPQLMPTFHRSHSASCGLRCSNKPNRLNVNNEFTVQSSSSVTLAAYSDFDVDNGGNLIPLSPPQQLLPLETACCGETRVGIGEISVETLASALTGSLDAALDGHSLSLIDCRFPYEWSAGRIRGAANIYAPDQLLEAMFHQLASLQSQKVVLVFYCELSSVRAPRLASYLRGQDRQLSLRQGRYPRLVYPQLCLLRGGYRAFHAARPDLCQPDGYARMSDPAFAELCASHVSQLNGWERMRHRRSQLRRQRCFCGQSDDCLTCLD